LIVLAVDNGAHASRFPAVLASNIPAHPIDPQLPPDAAANSMAAALVNVVAVPDPDMVPVTTLAYALPETSVPPPVSLGAAVKSPTYQAVGLVAEFVVKTQFKTRISV
jgi:hypothetical protein